MKEIKIDTETENIIKSMKDKKIKLYEDALFYVITYDEKIIEVFLDIETADSVNGPDEAKITKARLLENIPEGTVLIVNDKTVKEIYKVSTALSFTKRQKINFINRLMEFFQNIGNKTGRALYWNLLFQSSFGYDYLCINPKLISEKFPLIYNVLECGFLLLLNDNEYISLFPEDNLYNFHRIDNNKITEFIEQNKEKYHFEIMI